MRDSDFIKIAKCLADPTRHRILREIRAAGEMNCSQVCGCFKVSQPTISHHIKTLLAAGLIRVREQGQYHVISPREDTLKAFAEHLTGPAAPVKVKRARARA
jgi:ArsR family transcriptional regulator, arsenate/arsenite/antimonite-responsive transcriptional repressor